MTIGIDLRVLARGTRTGVEEYTINLLSELLSLESKINFKLFYNAYQKTQLNYPWLSLSNVELKDFRIPNRFFFTTARYFNRPKIDNLLKGVDIYFNPHFFVAPISQKCKKIITFHDLSFERYPGFFSWRKRIWQKFLMAAQQEAERASQIIAVSQSTKDDLINLYNIEPKKIKVIYSGVGEQFKNLESGILHKSTTNITNQYSSIREIRGKFVNISDLKLVIAGTKGWLFQDIFKAVQESKYRRDIIFTGFIEEADKPYLYNSAELFVYPSFFEGFGFPPLEAMACGLPTIVSHTSSLPEVVGDGALMIDPYNIDELAWAMDMALTDNDLRERLIEKGITQAKKFFWEKCAQETLKVLVK